MKIIMLTVSLAIGLRAEASATLLKKEKAIEVKLDVAAQDINKAKKLFKIHASNGSAEDVYFFDTQNLDLLHGNIILRARTGDDGDLTVKIRPIDLSSVAPDWQDESHFKCNLDVNPASQKEQCALKKSIDDSDLAQVISGKSALIELLSHKQLKFLDEYGGASIRWSDVLVIGPIRSIETDVPDSDVSAELWTLPSGEEFLELSAKTPDEDQVPSVLKVLRQVLKANSLKESGLSENKTEFVMREFIKHHP